MFGCLTFDPPGLALHLQLASFAVLCQMTNNKVDSLRFQFGRFFVSCITFLVALPFSIDLGANVTFGRMLRKITYSRLLVSYHLHFKLFILPLHFVSCFIF